MRNPIHDPEALWEARYVLRKAYTELHTLRQADPTIRCMITALDDLCAELTTEIDAGEPQLPLAALTQGVRR